MEDRRISQERLLGRRGLRAMSRLGPDFTDLDLGLSARDLEADLRPGLPARPDRRPL